jgi:hypothetical protein
MNSFYLRIGALCLALLPYSAYCQNIKSDTLFLSNSIDRVKAIYLKATSGEGPLFNGVQHKSIVLHNYDEGHPYFLSDDWIDGSIEYDGGLHDNISMQYDLTTDKIVIDHPISHFKMELISEKVTSFKLLDHTFIRLSPGTDSTKISIRPGFYELLYDGKVKVYAKQKKLRREVFESNVIKSIFDQKSQYYIWMDNVYYPVKGKGSVLNTFYKKKSALKKHLSKNKINFKKDTGLAIAKSAEFYDALEIQP